MYFIESLDPFPPILISGQCGFVPLNTGLSLRPLLWPFLLPPRQDAAEERDPKQAPRTSLFP